MLEPGDRALLLDSLRPPPEHTFDRAVGTTFTLDLHAMLAVPLALSAFDWEGADGRIVEDPIALLESLRRSADHIDLFCQAGEIAKPPNYHRLYSWLEQSIQPVRPPAEWAVFHPKVWVLRYKSSGDGPPSYRVLCMSRNLTFDRSWDTILRLDSSPAAANDTAPLAAFLRHLPRLAVLPLPAGRRTEILALADELEGISFEVPSGFSELSFLPLGLPGGTKWPFAEARRALVVSPFVTQAPLDRLLADTKETTIISRPEQLDRLPTEVLLGFKERLVLSPAALPDPDVVTDGHEILAGLHAKLFVTEDGTQARWLTGSANATDAAFDRNIELLVELRGARRRVGIDLILELPDAADGDSGLRRMLEAHPLPSAMVEPDEDELLSLALERLRRVVAGVAFQVKVETSGDDAYDLVITSAPLPSISEGTSSIRVRPLSLTGEQPFDGSAAVRFGPASVTSITPFLVVDLAVRRGQVTQTGRFVVRAALEGAPADRADRTTAAILETRRDVLRYLLFLLADAGAPSSGGVLGDLQLPADNHDAADSPATVELPLLEVLLRTAARDPRRLDAVQRLVETLSKTEEGRDLLPPGLQDVWPAIWATVGET